MFSYRHAFHAGNHGDVLKHAVLCSVLDYFNRKDAPYWVIDSHAGAGHYALDGDWASQRAEWADGVGRLWQRQDLPALLADYLARVRRHNDTQRDSQCDNYGDGAQLRYYPGSPWLALDALRPRDRLRLFELHPNESRALAANLTQIPRAQQRQTQCYAADGFDGIKALLPPPTRRAVVLIDPSYEDKRDYRRTQEALRAGVQRFATGCFMVWCPQVPRRDALELPRQLAKLADQQPLDWLHASLTVRRPDASGHGLYGSGVFLLNPPWTLAASLRETLPWLAHELAQDSGASYQLDARSA